MTINEDTGCITLPEIGAVISSSLSRSQFQQTAACSAASVSVRNEPWCSYRLPSIPQSDSELFIVLQFQGEQLCELHLSHAAPQFGTSWGDWSEVRELARKAFHERWLVHELHVPPGKYPWGDISSHYDKRGGSSSIILRYANRNA